MILWASILAECKVTSEVATGNSVILFDNVGALNNRIGSLPLAMSDK